MTEIKDIERTLRTAGKATQRQEEALKEAGRAMERFNATMKAHEIKLPVVRFAGLERAMESSEAIRRAMESVSRNQKAMRGALEPLASLRHSGMFDTIQVMNSQFAETARMIEQAQARYLLPEMHETSRLVQQLVADAQIRVEPFAAPMQEVMRTIESMHTPWLDMENSLQSVASLSALQGIGSALESLPSFDERLTAGLRERLGDWQERIAWPPEIAEDLSTRSMFYEERGFDRSLTAFPAPAFDEAAAIVGIIVEDYRIPAENAAKEDGHERTNAAHDRLTRFERRLRGFIDREMTAAVGPGWIKHRVPVETRKRWVERRGKEIAEGRQAGPLIDYADFTDYERIILRTDNWELVFKDVFRRPESVRESLQRLYPIRLCTMHARLITLDDELLLHVEVKRILKTIGVLGN